MITAPTHSVGSRSRLPLQMEKARYIVPSNNSPTPDPLGDLSFGAALRRRRKAKGWSLQMLAIRSRVSKTYVSTLETEIQPKNGKLPNPDMDFIIRLADALDWNRDEAIALAVATFVTKQITRATNAPAGEEARADRPLLVVQHSDGRDAEIIEGPLYEFFFETKRRLDALQHTDEPDNDGR